MSAWSFLSGIVEKIISFQLSVEKINFFTVQLAADLSFSWNRLLFSPFPLEQKRNYFYSLFDLDKTKKHLFSIFARIKTKFSCIYVFLTQILTMYLFPETMFDLLLSRFTEINKKKKTSLSEILRTYDIV